MDSRTGLITKPITEDTSFDPNNPIVNQSSALQVDNGLGGEVAKGLSRGTDTFQQGLYKVAELAGDVSGVKSLSNFGAEGASAQESQIADAAAKISSYTEVDSLDDAVNFLVGGAAEVFPQAVASLLGYSAAGTAAKLLGASSKVAGRVGAVASAVPSTASETGNLYGEIEDRTGNKDAVAAIGGGLAIGALEALPILDLIGGKNVGKSVIGSAIKQGGRTAVSEGITEGLQETVGQEAVKFSDPNYQYADGERLDNFINAGILGAVGGGVLGGTSAGVGKLLNPDRTINPNIQESNPFDTQNSPVANALAPEDLLSSPEAQEATQIFNSLQGVDNLTVNEGLGKLLNLKDQTNDPAIKSEIDRMVSSVVDTYSQQENTITSPGERVLNSDISYEQANTFEELQNTLDNEDFSVLGDEVVSDINQEASNQRGRNGSIGEQLSALEVNNDRGVSTALRIAEQEPANIPTLTFEDLTDKNNATYSILQSEETNKHRLGFARSKEAYDKANAQTVDVTVPGSDKVQKLNLVNLTNKVLKDRNTPIDENLSTYVKERGLNTQGVRAIQAAMQGISAFMNIDTSAYKTSKGKAITKDPQGNDIQLDSKLVDFRIEDIPDNTIFSITPSGKALRWGDYKEFAKPQLNSIDKVLSVAERARNELASLPPENKRSTEQRRRAVKLKRAIRRDNINLRKRRESLDPERGGAALKQIKARKELPKAREELARLESDPNTPYEVLKEQRKLISTLDYESVKDITYDTPIAEQEQGLEGIPSIPVIESRTPPSGGKVPSNEADVGSPVQRLAPAEQKDTNIDRYFNTKLDRKNKPSKQELAKDAALDEKSTSSQKTVKERDKTKTKVKTVKKKEIEKPKLKTKDEAIPKRLPEGSFFIRKGNRLHPVKGIAYFAIKKGDAVIYVHKVHGGWKASERTSGTGIGKIYKTKKEAVSVVQEKIKSTPESKLNALVKEHTLNLSDSQISKLLTQEENTAKLKTKRRVKAPKESKKPSKTPVQKKVKTVSKNVEKEKDPIKTSKPKPVKKEEKAPESHTPTQEEINATLAEIAKTEQENVVPQTPKHDKGKTKTSSTHKEKVEETVNSLLQKLGLKISYKVTNKVTTAKVPRGRVTMLEDGSFELFINSKLTGELREEVISHEVGHIIFRTVLSNQKSAYARAILADFTKWQKEFGGKGVKGIDIMKSKQTPKRILDALINATDLEATLDSMGEDSANYLLDFEEWFADRVGMWVHNEKTAPKGPVDKFFKEIGRLIRRLFNTQKSGESVDDFLDMLVRGTDTQRDGFTKFNISAVQKALTKEDKEELKKAGFSAILSKSATPEMLAALAVENAKNPTSKVNNILLRQLINEGMSTSTANTLRRAAMSTYIRTQLLKNVEAKYHRLYDDPDFAAAAAYQMWLSGSLKIGPKTETIFNKLVELLHVVLGVISDSKSMEKIFEAVRSGEASLSVNGKRFHIERIVSGGVAETVDKYFGSLWNSATNLSNKLLTSADTRLRKTEIPALIELADKFHTEAGAIGKDVTYSQGKLEASGRFESKVNSIFKDLSKEDSSIVIEVLNNPKLYGKAPKSVKTTIDKVRIVMKELRDYMVDNGLELGNKGETYFPWVADTDYLIANQEDFLALVSQDKFKPELKKLRKFFSYKTDEKGNPILPSIEKIPGLLFDHFRGENGFMDSVPRDVTNTPNNRFMNVRILSFITEKGNDEDFAKLSAFLSKDIGITLYNYIHASTKRAEYARVFGADETKLETLYSKALDQGATARDMKLAYDYVHAISGTLGRDTALWLSDSFIGKKLNISPESGRPINTKLQSVMSSVMVYQNLRVLTLATLNSLVDPLGIAVRSNSILPVFSGLKNSLSEVLSKDKSELRQLSESLGVISDSITNDALGWEYGGAYMSSGTRQVNDTFFKYIGLQGLTKQTRVMAVSGGLEFLKKHATRPNKHSTRYLNELSVSKSDIKIGKDGKVKLLSMPERKALETKGTDKAKEELARDDRVRHALVQFVDESILRPNPSQRPIWASDPHFMLIFHLKSFMYAFHDRILMRVASELSHGNMSILLQLGMFIPVMLASLFIRDLIKFGEEAPWKENWDFWDFIVDAAYKAGLPGVGSILANDVANDSKFGKIPGVSLLGPTVSQITNPDLKKALPFQQIL